MGEQRYDYVIAGAGLAGGSAIEGIREVDANGSILLVGAEEDRPYHRPPLSKDLWTGDKSPEEIYVHEKGKLEDWGVEALLGRRVSKVAPDARRVSLADGSAYEYGTLLLATGGTPRRLDIPGGDAQTLCYYRTAADYRALAAREWKEKPVIVVGAGFIGAEMAAALHGRGARVTMIFPEEGLCPKIFPEAMGRAMREEYARRGIAFLAGDVPRRFEAAPPDGLRMHTRAGETVEAVAVVAGIGIEPATELAEAAGLAVKDGVVVDDRLCSSDPHIFAAGDNAFFPCALLESRTRIEHWDNARAQGRQAGRNMAGADEAFTYLPFFFSDLFDFGFEAVGEVDARLETLADWEEPNRKGVIYYLRDGRMRGALMADLWEKVDAARELISRKETITADHLPDLDAVAAS